ncbi:TonB-dependent receptor [Parapedobacter tibetensis]|uniref:TonB-dependent receptor n=1 Tax=Parapedobacter tibetensis TaxID=2972951 RepID=UPI00214DD82E|nr:TonB-dependent receptor [Parapedobacter tibetensis]
MITKEIASIILIYVSFCPALFGQVTGRIIDLYTGNPVGNATIAIGDSLHTLSDGSGYFDLPSTPVQGTLSITSLGYQVTTTRFTAGQFLQVRLKTSGITLSEVMITGYQTGRKLIENAGGISVLGAEELHRQPAIDLMPAINTVPGVKMEAYNYGNYRLSIRGSLLRSPWSVRNVKMYWNDIPMTTAGGGNPISLMDVSSLGSLEILKGPAGSMYGAGTGGVLLFRSKTAPFNQKSVGASFTAGSYGLYRTTLSANMSTENASLVANYINQHSDGYRLQQRFGQQAINLMGTFSPNARQSISFFVLHNKNDIQLPGGLTEEEARENPRQAATEFNTLHNTSINSTNTNVGISHRYTWSGRFDNTTSVSTNYRYVDHPFGSGPSYNGYMRENGFGYGARTQFNYRASVGSTEGRFSIGTEAQRSFVSPKYYENLEGGEPGKLYNDNEVVAIGYSVFAQAEFDITNRILFTLGASLNGLTYEVTDLYREDGSNSSGKRKFEPVFSPRVAAVYRINDAIGAHASISYGFAQPDNSEIFNPGGIVNDIRPEKGVNYEAGIRGSIAQGRFGFDVTAYNLQLTDEIVSKRDESWQTIYSNAGATSHRGVEASVYYDWQLSPNAVLSGIKPWANVTYNDFVFREYLSGGTMDVAGNDIPGVSPFVVAGGIDVLGPAGLYLSAVTNYYSRIFLNDQNTDMMDGYMLLGGKLGYRTRLLMHWQVDLHAGVENATNTLYSSLPNLNASGDAPRYYNVSPARSLRGGLSLQYIF